MSQFDYNDFIGTTHQLYARYIEDWNLAVKSFYGGVEYRDGNFLKAYDSDYSTPSEVINTYDVDEYGQQTGVYKSSVQRVNTPQEAETGTQYASNFYQEKLKNVPVFPYTRLYTSEYNAILFRSPPSRVLPDTPEVNDFIKDADKEGNSLNEFMSHVDTFTTVFGVVWVSCMKQAGAEYAQFKMHKPTDVYNWHYTYNEQGELELDKILIRIAEESNMDIFHYITKDEMHTIFAPASDDSIIDSIPETAQSFTDTDGNTYHRIIQENPLGYVPVRPVYQSSKIHNGIGHTPIFDIAQIQRSIYNTCMAEIYSAVSYGAHPVTVCDEETLNRNDQNISAEPGSLVVVPNSLNGQPNHVFTFESPSLDSINELRELMDQLTNKMNEVAMIRSDDLIKASRSGAQIEQYDSKLEAFVRKKATALEQAEYNLWKIWFDWMDQDIPEDLTISYNRLYSQKGVENEIKEMNTLLDAYERYAGVFLADAEVFEPAAFATELEAEEEAQRLGGTGTHSHEQEDGTLIYMPFQTHEEYDMRLTMAKGVEMEEAPAFKNLLKEKIKKRLNQLIDSTYSDNSL